MSKYRRLKNKQHVKRAYLRQVKLNQRLVEEAKKKRAEKRKMLRSNLIWSDEEPTDQEVEICSQLQDNVVV